MTETVSVDLGERSYDIIIGSGLMAEAGRIAGPLLQGRKAVIVTDETVGKLHLRTLQTSLEQAGVRLAEPILVPPGERSKEFRQLDRVLDELLARGIERSAVVIALGGGVVGDLAGFAAAIALRGLDFIQIPTTLLAQVDSSVGGKTGINSPRGKNLIGAFHQPSLVLADIGALDTLPRREVLAGYAEVVKYGLIDDPVFFEWLERNGAALVEGDRDLRSEAVKKSCAAKAAIVGRDERESGDRALLNLGHTFGHALEATAGYGESLLHGEAVAIGMVMAFDLSVRLGLCPPGEAARVRRHLSSVGLPTDLRDLRGPGWTAPDLIRHMGKDKKVKDGRITFILVRDIGQAFVARDIQLGEVEAVLETALAA
jgi:3-dehydroquinate synthase